MSATSRNSDGSITIVWTIFWTMFYFPRETFSNNSNGFW